MAQLINKLFNVRANEWPRILALSLMIILTSAGATWGSTITYAAFLKQVGLEALPWILVASSALSIVATAVYTAFVDRVSNERLLLIIFAIGAASALAGWGLIQLGQPLLAYPLLYLLFLAWAAVFNPHIVTYINSFYDIQAAKRTLPVVLAGFRAGAIVAGLTMPLLTQLDASLIIVIWFLTYLAGMGITWLTPRLLKEDKPVPAVAGLPATAGGEKQRPSYLDNMREGFRYATQSTYLRWITTGTLLLMVLMSLVEYKSSQLLVNNLGTQKQLADFLALLVGVGNIIVLPMLMFGLSRLITRLGLNNATLIFPAGNLAICSSLLFVPGLASGAAGYLDRTAFRIAFQSPIDSLLYNAVPLRVKGRIRAFVGGLIVPVGSLLGGLLLLLPLAPTTTWFVPALIGLLAVAYLISAWFIRQQYSQALVKMLEQEDYSFLLSQEASDLTVTDPATLTRLHKKLEESTSHELTVFIAKLISQVGGSRALPILGPATRSAQDARTRAALVDVLVAADLRDDAVRQIYTDLLADPDGHVRQSAIAGLELLAGQADGQFVKQMLDMIQDPDLSVRVRALSALVGCTDLYQLPAAVQVLDQLLTSQDAGHRTYGVQVLERIGSERAIGSLVPYLADEADQVRLGAALAIERLSQNTLPPSLNGPIIQKASALLRDPVERARQAALTILGRLGTREPHKAMVDSLADPSPRVRATAVDALVQAGKAVIPLVHPKLNAPDPQLRKMAAVILGRVNPREFGSLIVGSNITGNLLAIYRNHGFAQALAPGSQYPSLLVLQSALREQNQQLLDEIFYLLTALHDPGAVRIVSDSLHNPDARVRANAREALESLTTPQVASLIAPLFEPELPPGQLLSLSKETWDMEQPDASQAIQQLITQPEEPWLRALTTFAVGEVGAKTKARLEVEARAKAEAEAKAKAKAEAGQPGQDKPARRRRAPTDLLGALAGSPPAGEAESAPPTPRRGRRAPAADLLGAVEDKPLEAAPPAAGTPPGLLTFSLPDIEAMVNTALADTAADVRSAAQAAQRMLTRGSFELDLQAGGKLHRMTEEDILLSVIEKIIFLKEVPFFQGMTIDQLKVLASVCEEELFEKDTRIYKENDPGGVLYVIVSGRVGIEQEKRPGSFARLETLEAHSYFGEMDLFENSPRTTSAIAVNDTLTLRLRREPLIALARQHPDLSLELINVLSQRLREASDRIADLTRSRHRKVQQLFDQFES